MPYRAVEAATLVPARASLAYGPLSRRAVPITPVDRPRCFCRLLPDRAAFPELRAGRRPQPPFRGLLRLHSRYGPSIRSAAQGDVCRRASILPVARPTACQLSGRPTFARVGLAPTRCSRPSGTHEGSLVEFLLTLRVCVSHNLQCALREALSCFLCETPCALGETLCQLFACFHANGPLGRAIQRRRTTVPAHAAAVAR